MPTHTLSEVEFARLFEQHSRALWCVAVAILRNRDEADDVLQESALKGLEKRGEFTRGTSFVHWMSQIVRFTALNEGRRRRVRQHVGVHATNEPPDHSRDESEHELAEAFDDRTLAALASLDETARVCLLMRTILDWSYHQISEALQIAEGTAMSHVHRSRQRLRSMLLASQRDGDAARIARAGGA
jgi:RNA polymerase sigma-70 factor (ECF subfamily)